MFTQQAARRAQALHRKINVFRWERAVAIGNRLPAILDMHREDRDQHRDHHRNGCPAGRDTEEERNRAADFGRGGEEGHQPRQRQAQSPIGIAEPFDDALEAGDLVRSGGPANRHQVEPQCERSEKIHLARGIQQVLCLVQ